MTVKINADYHTHTVYSHGTGTIRENVEEAYRKGLKEIAICDHGPGHYLYGVKENEIFKMRQEIDLLNEEFEAKGLKILLGLEANITGFDGTIDVNERILKTIDILLVGYHYGVTPNSLKDALGLYIMNPLAKIFPFIRKRAIEKNTLAFIRAIKSYPVDIISHPGAKVELDIRKLAREAGKQDTALEINNKHGYLSVEDIKLAAMEEVDFYLGSDAHRPEDVGEIDGAAYRADRASLDPGRIKNLKL